MYPKVSVIIPVYNAQRFIKQTLESVLNQTYQNFEIRVVDDGSTDKSAQIIKGFTDKRIVYIYQGNQGVSVARNKGLSASKGEYLALLDHDDLWLPEKLEKQVPVLDNDPEVGLVYSDCYFDMEGRATKRAFAQTQPFRGRVLHQLFLSNFIPCLTAVMRKEVFEKAGLFNPGFFIAEEYDLFLRIAESFKIDYVDLPLARYRIHETNFSKNVILTNQEEIKVLNSCLQRNPGLKRQLGQRRQIRLAGLQATLGRLHQFQRDFAVARTEFISSIKYYPWGIKSYIGYFSSLLGIVIPGRDKIVKAFFHSIGKCTAKQYPKGGKWKLN